MDIGSSPEERRRRQALALTALVALVIGAFATGGYLYRASSRSGQTHPSKAAPEERRIGTGGVGSAARPAKDSSAQARASASPADAPHANRGSVPAEASPSPAAGQHDVTGAWTIDTRIDESGVGPFRGLRLRYLVNLVQEGNRITGGGRKVSENGTGLPPPTQTRITVVGAFDGDQLRLTFRERGARRESTGTFLLRRESGDSLRGSFSSNVAHTSGAVEAHRR